MIIYKITNKINGDSYVGQTIQLLKERWYAHCGKRAEEFYLGRAIKKYGKENFVVEEIGTYSNLEDLNNAEEYYIDWHNTRTPNGYNIESGGKNKRHHEETKLKIRLANSGKNSYLYGTKGNFFGKKHSQKSLEKMHAAKLGHIVTTETRLKISKTLTGRPTFRGRKIKCLNNDKIYSCAQEAAKELNCLRRLIDKVAKGNREHTKGYRFIYV